MKNRPSFAFNMQNIFRIIGILLSYAYPWPYPAINAVAPVLLSCYIFNRHFHFKKECQTVKIITTNYLLVEKRRTLSELVVRKAIKVGLFFPLRQVTLTLAVQIKMDVIIGVFSQSGGLNRIKNIGKKRRKRRRRKMQLVNKKNATAASSFPSRYQNNVLRNTRLNNSQF